MHFGYIFRILSQEIDSAAQNALFRPKSPLGQKGLHFHQNSIGFISIRAMGTQKCIFSQKEHFCAQNALLCPKCVLEPKSDFWSKNPLFGVRPAPEAKRGEGMWVRESSKGHFLLQIALCDQKSLFAPKVHFGLKMHFWAQNWFWSKKCDFCDFGPKWLHLSFVLKVFGAKCKNYDFHDKNPQMWKVRGKDFRQRVILETFQNFHKNHISDTSVFTTAVHV